MLCANGFRDTTRIASSSPEMWRDIALANRQNLLRALEAFTEGLQDFRRALQERGRPGRYEVLRAGQGKARAVVEASPKAARHAMSTCQRQNST